MTVLDIVTYPADILRDGTEAVEQVDDQVKKLIVDMAETMYARAGVGLAAVQVGSNQRLLIYDISEEREQRNFRVVINPEIVAEEDVYLSEREGCLSVPELRVDVKRSAIIELKGLDREGQPFKRQVQDFEAAVIQHELDHLEGVLILDWASLLKRKMYKKKIKKRLKQDRNDDR